MSNGDLATIVAVVGLIMSAGMLYLGIPAWRIARHSVGVQRAADEQAEFNRRLLKALTGSEELRDTSPEHPAAMDLLSDIREMLKEHSELTTIVAWHVSDKHGPDIPALGRRRR